MEPFSVWATGAAGGWLIGKALDRTSSFAADTIKRMSTSGTVFLNHDPRHSNKFYSEVGPKLGGTLPYLEIADFTEDILTGQRSTIVANVNEQPFFTQASDFEWAQARARAYLDYREDGHAGTDSPVLRVDSATRSETGLELSIRPTRYFCQAESNLVLDREVEILARDEGKVTVTLRQLLAAGSDGQLPPLEDRRLANSLGVAVCFLSKDHAGRIALRMVRRSKKVGVFPNGVHPAMSCAIKWAKPKTPQKPVDLMDLILPDIQNEMVQETGLSPNQYSTPVPLSFCREFLRGGKPQLFCLSYTDLTHAEINEARDRQMAANRRDRPEKVEVLASGWLSSRDPSTIIGKQLPAKLTHEGAAAFHLVSRLFGG